jgi:hypothetical protein
LPILSREMSILNKLGMRGQQRWGINQQNMKSIVIGVTFLIWLWVGLEWDVPSNDTAAAATAAATEIPSKTSHKNDPFTQFMRNRAFHQHNLYTFLSQSKHFSSVIHLLLGADVIISYCKQRAGQLVMSPPTARVAHLVSTVGEYSDQVAWNATWSGNGLIDAMRWHGCMDGPEILHVNGAAITHQAMDNDLLQLMRRLPDVLPNQSMPKNLQLLYK